MTPHLVQEALATTPRIGQEQFAFLLCQHGTEPTLKARWLGGDSPLRLAFSRPGLLTFKTAEGAPAAVSIGDDWMVRLAGLILGQVKGELVESMVDEALTLAGTDWDAVHVFLRDSGLPGVKGFEPGPTLLGDEIAAIFARRWPTEGAPPRINAEAEVGSRVLDIVIADPQHWLIGHHQVQRSHERWPGGAYSAPEPNEMISRAYLKMAEA